MPHLHAPVHRNHSERIPSSDPRGPQHLFKILIERLCSAGQIHRLSADEPDEVVLELELDGYRYLVVRTLKPSREPVELSPREKEIVRMVAQGHPNKIIAGVLNISCWTVCTHLRRVFAKLGVGSRAAMIARLHETGSIGSAARHLAATGAGAEGFPGTIQKIPCARRGTV